MTSQRIDNLAQSGC